MRLFGLLNLVTQDVLVEKILNSVWLALEVGLCCAQIQFSFTRAIAFAFL